MSLPGDAATEAELIDDGNLDDGLVDEHGAMTTKAWAIVDGVRP